MLRLNVCRFSWWQSNDCTDLKENLRRIAIAVQSGQNDCVRSATCASSILLRELGGQRFIGFFMRGHLDSDALQMQVCC